MDSSGAPTRLRLAFFTPVSPQKSGISDYSEELLPELAKLAEVDVVIGAYPPSGHVTRQFRVIGAEEFLSKSSQYNCTIYQIGNNLEYHEYMLPCMQAVPGIAVLHDYSLSYLVLGVTLMRGNMAALVRILERTHGAKAYATARAILTGAIDHYEVSLALPIAEMSRGVIVHNQYARRRLEKDAPGKTIKVIRHATPIREPAQNWDDLRARFGFARGDFLIASISTLAYNKRSHLLINSVRALKNAGVQAKLLCVGQGRLGTEAQKLIHRKGLDGDVVCTGWVSAEDYLAYIDAADVVADLRYPTAGETSGSALRAMQAGKPLIVSEQGFFLELPDDCCMRIPVGTGEQELLDAALLTLARDPDRRRRTGMSGRDFVLRNLRIEDAARAYVDFVRDIISAPKQAVGDGGFTATKRTPGSMFISTVYRLSRLRSLNRSYGLVETVRRVMARKP